MEGHRICAMCLPAVLWGVSAANFGGTQLSAGTNAAGVVWVLDNQRAIYKESHIFRPDFICFAGLSRDFIFCGTLFGRCASAKLYLGDKIY